MRPRLLTPRNLLLLLIAALLLGGTAYWLKLGMPLPWGGVPSTAGKIAYVTENEGKSHIAMMNADGTGAVALTSGAADDRAPAWSPNGSDIAFVSENRAGVNPQVFEMHAIPGASIGQLTHTDSAKDSPIFGHDGRVYYLDAGKVTVTTADGTDSDALLPNHDQRQPAPGGHGDIFAAGGIQQAAPSPDGTHLVAVMRTERGDALLLYDMSENQHALYLLGIADHIHFSFLPDGTFAAVFSGAEPFKQGPFLLFSKDSDAGEQASQLTREQLAFLQGARSLLIDPDSAPAEMRPVMDKKIQLIAIFDAAGKAVGGFALPGLAPDSVTASPVGAQLLVSSDQSNGGGVLLADFQSQQVRSIFKDAAREPAWSPDGTRFSFTSGDAIYIGAISSSEPKRIASGPGRSYGAVWSPARAKK